MVTERQAAVFTPLGKGRIVYELPDGTLVVEFEHGSGHIFHAQEIYQYRVGGSGLHVENSSQNRPVRGSDVP